MKILRTFAPAEEPYPENHRLHLRPRPFAKNMHCTRTETVFEQKKPITHHYLYPMKRILFLLVTLSLCQACAPTEAPTTSLSAEEEKIAKALIQGAFDDLWGGVDSTKISQYHTDDFIILEQGEVWDNDRIKQFMRGQLAQPNRAKRINRMDYISLDKYGNSIQIAYYNYAEFTQADTLVGKAAWLESALAVSTPEGWRLKSMHSTRMRN